MIRMVMKKGIPECLVKSMGDTDIIARLGGDEFLLTVPGGYPNKSDPYLNRRKFK